MALVDLLDTGETSLGSEVENLRGYFSLFSWAVTGMDGVLPTPEQFRCIAGLGEHLVDDLETKLSRLQVDPCIPGGDRL